MFMFFNFTWLITLSVQLSSLVECVCVVSDVYQHDGVMGEMLHAAGQIGDAFAGMVTNARQSGERFFTL